MELAFVDNLGKEDFYANGGLVVYLLKGDKEDVQSITIQDAEEIITAAGYQWPVGNERIWTAPIQTIAHQDHPEHILYTCRWGYVDAGNSGADFNTMGI